MKRITVLLFVCLFAASSVFAAVDFSGSLSAGYTFNYDNGGSGEWETAIYGEDGDDTNTTQIDLNIAPDMGLKFYAGANDLEEAGDTYFAGGTVDYTHKGITYALNVDYSCPDGQYSESVVNTRTGFSVTPSISVAF